MYLVSKKKYPKTPRGQRSRGTGGLMMWFLWGEKDSGETYWACSAWHILHLSAVTQPPPHGTLWTSLCPHPQRHWNFEEGRWRSLYFVVRDFDAQAAVHRQCVPALCIVLLHLLSFTHWISFAFEGLSKHCCLQMVITSLHYYYVCDLWGSLAYFFFLLTVKVERTHMFSTSTYIYDTNML